MRFMLSSVRKDLARWNQDRTAILIWLGIPFMIGGMMTLLMGGDDVRPRGVLLVADQDASLLSGLFTSAFGQGGLGDLIVVESVSLAGGNERIDDGDASALLVIPEGFGDALLGAEPVSLALTTNPSQTILPGIITDVTEILLDAGFYARRLFASEIEAIRAYDDGSTPDAAVVAAIAVAIQDKIAAATPHLIPPIIDLEIAEPPPEVPSPPIALLFLPGIVLMAVMFAANGLAADYWSERDNGTLRRLVLAPGRLTGFLAGKALAAGAVIGVIALLTLAAGFLYHGLDMGRLPLSLSFVTVAGIGLFAWFGAVQMLFRTQRAANLISSLILFPLLMVGGSFFPLDVLPDWLAAIGRLSPNGYIVDRLTQILTLGEGWNLAPAAWSVVLLMAASGLSLSAWRLRSGFAQA